jgi:hypothetical protein
MQSLRSMAPDACAFIAENHGNDRDVLTALQLIQLTYQCGASEAETRERLTQLAQAIREDRKIVEYA